MKKIVAILGVGFLGLTVMSSTCSSNSDAATSAERVAPGPGISFEKMTFEKAKKEAKKSGKLIFIDAYTDWCGPCKRMAATSFQDPSVGEVFNKNFINLKIEMEKSEEGPEIARQYGVRAYPTLLIVDGDGRLVKQSIGMKSSDQLIALAKSVI